MLDRQTEYILNLDPDSVCFGLIITPGIERYIAMATEIGSWDWFLFAQNAGPDLQTARQILNLRRRTMPRDRTYELGFGLRLKRNVLVGDVSQYGIWTPQSSSLSAVPLGRMLLSDIEFG